MADIWEGRGLFLDRRRNGPLLHDWPNKLNDNERHFISHAFFAASDGIVVECFSNEV
jgi:hypothetical protein